MPPKNLSLGKKFIKTLTTLKKIHSRETMTSRMTLNMKALINNTSKGIRDHPISVISLGKNKLTKGLVLQSRREHLLQE